MLYNENMELALEPSFAGVYPIKVDQLNIEVS